MFPGDRSMAQQLRTSALKKIKPRDLTKTVEQTFVEAITNRKAEPEAGKEANGSLGMQPAVIPAPQPDDAVWPMPVAEFQHGHFLEPADVVLSTRLESFFSFLVKRFDDSRFAHASLAFITPRHYPGVDRTYLIESTFGGVDLGSFSEIVAPTKVYKDTKDKPRYVVGIKRLETSWFSPAMRPMVGGRMLRFIKDDDYNFSLLAALAFSKSSFVFRMREKLFGSAPTVSDFLRRSRQFAPMEFICSGFVQFAYVDMVRSAIERGSLPLDEAERACEEVLFAPWVTPRSTMEDLMAVKPLELASSERLKWKYLIYGGLAHKVSSDDDVHAIFDKINAEARVRYKP
jgi:hypothetical protein